MKQKINPSPAPPFNSPGISHSINRREFGIAVAAATLTSASANGIDGNSANQAGSITDVPGIKVGHFTETRRPTGCTVVLTGDGAVCGVDVRGSAPGTREIALLDPINIVQEVHGIVLSGGSAFGLDTAGGVMQFLEEKNIGFPTGNGVVPIVPAAILYDLGIGDPSIRPGREAGYKACQAASEEAVEEGNVGAGAGATVGKMFGSKFAMKSGIGTASFMIEDLVVAAIVAVNAVGDVINPSTGQILAGARNEDGFINTAKQLKKRKLSRQKAKAGENTTIGIVATNVTLSKIEATKVAQMAHDGLARAINPVHLTMDGDTIFALATGKIDYPNLSQVGALAAEAMALAVNRAVLCAKGIEGYPAANGGKL
jgi:L-aminopeptidase/D-esterase-like protein